MPHEISAAPVREGPSLGGIASKSLGGQAVFESGRGERHQPVHPALSQGENEPSRSLHRAVIEGVSGPALRTARGHGLALGSRDGPHGRHELDRGGIVEDPVVVVVHVDVVGEPVGIVVAGVVPDPMVIEDRVVLDPIGRAILVRVIEPPRGGLRGI
jgi:hypothetical protein